MIKAVNRFARRIVRDDELRRTRLHDEKGNRAPASQLVRLPEMLVWAAARRVFGVMPPGPWIPINARRAIAEILRPDWSLVEFGSGMSTLWWAEQVATVHSIESNSSWYFRLVPQLPSNVRYELREERDAYPSLDEPDGSIDLAVVDGLRRDACVLSVLPKIRPGGWIYLDNSDKDQTQTGDGLRGAERAILEAVKTRDGEVRYFTGLVRGLLCVNQGMLAQLRK